MAATKASKAAAKGKATKSKAVTAKTADVIVADDEAPTPAKTATKTKKTAEKPKAKPKGLVQHVFDTLDGELTKLEGQIGETSQDRERASRALSQMVSSLKNTVEMQHEMERRAKRSGKVKDKQEAARAEEKRRELAERIDCLKRKQRARKNASAT
jgi:hypothetical protein